jgi:hypothetical protein
MLQPEKYCPFCGKKIGGNQITCNRHYADYKRMRDEPWMRMLKSDLEREYRYELRCAAIEQHGDAALPREYNRMTEENIKNIAELRALGHGAIRIAKALGLNSHAVKYHIARIDAANKQCESELEAA